MSDDVNQRVEDAFQTLVSITKEWRLKERLEEHLYIGKYTKGKIFPTENTVRERE